ncbi:hypothetical protein LLH00_09165 [bacterium]|nr:hypothetical protein [bacterium]
MEKQVEEGMAVKASVQKENCSEVAEAGTIFSEWTFQARTAHSQLSLKSKKKPPDQLKLSKAQAQTGQSNGDALFLRLKTGGL